MQIIIKDGMIVATALDGYARQGWEQDVLDAPDGLTAENMDQYVYADGAVSYPAEDIVRAERDKRLSETDWIISKGTEQAVRTGLALEIPAAWLDYRQALRDVTDQAGFPDAVVWPVMPV